MSTVTPSQPSPPPSSGAGQNAANAVVIKGASQLVNVTVGQVVDATVTAKNGPNQAQIQTPFGPMTLQSVMALPKGSALTLVLSTLTPPSFMIGMVDGKPVPGALTQAQAKAAGLPLSQGAQVLPKSQPLQAGGKLAAVLLRPAQTPSMVNTVTGTPTGSSPQTQASMATPQQTVTNLVQGATQMVQGATPQTATTSTTQPGATSSATNTPASSSSPTPSAMAMMAKGANIGSTASLPSGTRFTITIQSIEPPSAALSTPSMASAKGIVQGQIVTGTIIGRTPQGQPIVQTPNATISLDSKAVLTDGTKVTFKFDTAPLPALPSQAAQRMGRAGLGLGLAKAKTWDDFSEALKTLAASDPQRLQSVVQTALPQPGPKLGNQMLFFLNALKGGDIKSLFGESAARIIDKERPQLLSKLGGDFHVMSKMADEPQSGDWRLALIPLWNGEKLDQIRFYHRGGGKDEEGKEDDEGTRFVLDVELSNFGHLQLDGFMKATKKRLDLIVRTEQALPEDMRNDISVIGKTAEEVMGLFASISFQGNPDGFVEFPPNIAQDQGLLA